jgi:hypothetical protein
MDKNIQNCNHGEAQLEQKVENIMISKMHLLIGIIAFMVPVLGFFFKIQLDVALIKQNHEAHMQTALEEIADLKKADSELQKKLDTDHDAIIRLLQMSEK